MAHGSRLAGLGLLLAAGCGVELDEPESVPYVAVIELAEFSDTYQDYGAALVRADLTGDGRDELLIGSPATAPTDFGVVLVCSLETFEVLGALFPWTDPQDGTAHHEEFGRSIAAGDWNHDGWIDVAVGDPRCDLPDAESAGEVWYYPGPVDASVFVRLRAETPAAGARFGATLAQGDFDGDGWLDLAVAAPGDGAGGSGECLTCLYGPDFTRRETRAAGDAGSPFGVALAALPAASASDATQPLLAGAPEATDGTRAAGSAFAYRADGDPQRLEPSDPADAGFGAALELGDFSARGARQLAVLANAGGGALYLYDACQLGAPRRIGLPAPFAHRGGAPLCRLTDVSRDGVDELVLLSANRDDPTGLVFSPGHGAAHLRLDFAAAAALVADLDADGVDELLLSTPTSFTPGGSYASLRIVDFTWQEVVKSAGTERPRLVIPGVTALPPPLRQR